MGFPDGPRRRILELLAARQAQPSPDLHRNGLRLKDLSAALGLRHPTVLAHLGKLMRDRWVEPVEVDGVTLYCAAPRLEVTWSWPRERRFETWATGVPVDWRFSLVPRVPDAAAQRFLYEWLDRAQARGLLPAYCSRFEPQDPRPRLLQVVVYGSCARGEARVKSDLDLLLYGDTRKADADALVGLAHEVALRGGRNPDIRRMDGKTWQAAEPDFRAAVRREGKTAFTNDPDAPFLEQPVADLHG